ncbi:MAG: TMCO4 family protein [Nostoc sp. LLA-1]|nr:TMCO4 family protein [Cyanocohniella sp. LLY]
MKSPELRLLSRPAGSSKALIFIDGYLNEEKVRNSHLLYTLSNAGWRHSVYHLWWDSGLIESCMMGLAIGHWHKTKYRAKQVGRDYFLDLISNQISEKNVSLVAHSLGVRVAYYCMESWTEKQYSLQDVILLAGAVRRDSSKDWGYVASQIKGKLINVYSSKDIILRHIFKMAELGNNACGRKPIKEYHSKIINEDATYVMGTSHSASQSLNYLTELVKKGLWQI